MYVILVCCHPIWIKCVADEIDQRTLVAVSSKASVMLFTVPEGKYKGLITRHTLPVRCLDFSRDGQFVASAGEYVLSRPVAPGQPNSTRYFKRCRDLVVKITQVSNIQNSVEFSSHKSPVTGMSFDPLGTYLSSVSERGGLLIFNISDRTVAYEMDLGRGAPRNELYAFPLSSA
jgi:WD40 repeat protein